MDEEALTDVVAMAYGAASGANTWFEFGTSLCRLVGAQRSTLRMLDDTLVNLLAPGDAADAAYRAARSAGAMLLLGTEAAMREHTGHG